MSRLRDSNWQPCQSDNHLARAQLLTHSNIFSNKLIRKIVILVFCIGIQTDNHANPITTWPGPTPDTQQYIFTTNLFEKLSIMWHLSEFKLTTVPIRLPLGQGSLPPEYNLPRQELLFSFEPIQFEQKFILTLMQVSSPLSVYLSLCTHNNDK